MGGPKQVRPDAYYVRPAPVEMPGQTALVRRETFAPILYVVRYRELDDAIAAYNAVPQGLAFFGSSLFDFVAACYRRFDPADA